MFSTKEIIKDKRYPDFILKGLSNLTYLRKIFPDIGLSNFEDQVLLDNSKEIISFAKPLLEQISSHLLLRAQKLLIFSKKSTKIGKKRLESLTLLSSTMTDLSLQIRKNPDSFIKIDSNKKIAISLQNDLLYDQKVFLKKGMSLFKVYVKFNSILIKNKFVALPDISKENSFKNFCNINLPFKELKVIFSSSNKDGIWDIATMSMRGITSCQTWGSGQSTRLLGSIIDPMTAIIYITNNSMLPFGKKMLRRCIVRYIVLNNKPSILLEKMYPAFDKPSLDIFVKAISDRTNLPVHYSADLGTKLTLGNQLYNAYVPLSDELSSSVEECIYPYADSGIPFKYDKYCLLSRSPEKRNEILKTMVRKALISRLKCAKLFGANAIKKFGKNDQLIMSDLRGRKKHPSLKIKSLNEVANDLVLLVLEKSKDSIINSLDIFNKNTNIVETYFTDRLAVSKDLSKYISTNISV